MPEVLQTLIDRRGFGFIWALFVAHCYKPEIYPLYDQHVYRTYISLQSNGSKKPTSAPADWEQYIKYCNYFKEQLKISEMTQIECDRALWAYGKSIKEKKLSSAKHSIFKDSNSLDNLEELAHSFTLGGKRNSYWWSIDKNCNVTISRRFSPKTGNLRHVRIISKEEINKILQYLDDFDHFYLRNSVSKLKNGTEKSDGIGYFMFNNLKWNSTESQLASHLAAVFCDAGLWRNNGAKRNITLEKITDTNWCVHLLEYYTSQVMDE